LIAHYLAAVYGLGPPAQVRNSQLAVHNIASEIAGDVAEICSNNSCDDNQYGDQAVLDRRSTTFIFEQ